MPSGDPAARRPSARAGVGRAPASRRQSPGAASAARGPTIRIYSCRPWNPGACQVQLATRLRYERALRIGQNEMLEPRDRRGIITVPAQRACPLELGRWRLRRRALLFDDAFPQRDGLRVILE